MSYLQQPESETKHVPIGEFKQFYMTRVKAAKTSGKAGGIMSTYTSWGQRVYEGVQSSQNEENLNLAMLGNSFQCLISILSKS